MCGYVPFEEKLDVYENRYTKDTIKTLPRGMAEHLWGGKLQLQALLWCPTDGLLGTGNQHTWAPAFHLASRIVVLLPVLPSSSGCDR